MKTTDQIRADKASEFATGLRLAADLIEANPGLDWPMYEGAITINLGVWEQADPEIEGDTDEEAAKRKMVEIRRQIGGFFEKHTSDWAFTLRKKLSRQVRVDIYANRDAVCERIVVGTEKKAVKEIPEDKQDEATKLRAQLAALEIEVEKEIDVVEWKCPDALAIDPKQKDQIDRIIDAGPPADEFAESRGPDGVVGQDADHLEAIADSKAAAAEISDSDLMGDPGLEG